MISYFMFHAFKNWSHLSFVYTLNIQLSYIMWGGSFCMYIRAIFLRLYFLNCYDPDLNQKCDKYFKHPEGVFHTLNFVFQTWFDGLPFTTRTLEKQTLSTTQLTFFHINISVYPIFFFSPIFDATGNCVRAFLACIGPTTLRYLTPRNSW